jgi:ferredoxin
MPILTLPEDALRIEVEIGESLQDACTEHTTSVLFGCFSARCGICRIQVLENPAGLSEMTEMEKELLEMLSAPPGERLACQCKIVGDVTIHTVTQR